MALKIFTLVNHRPTSFVMQFVARFAINQAINQNLPAIQQAVGNPAKYDWVTMYVFSSVAFFLLTRL
jgi:hypothetical protein